MKKHFILMIAFVLNSPLYASGLQKNIKTQKSNQKTIDKNERMYNEALDQYFKLTRNIALTKAYVAWLERQEDKLQNQIAVVEKKILEEKLLDTMVNDGLIDAFNNYHMGVTAENVNISIILSI